MSSSLSMKELHNKTSVEELSLSKEIALLKEEVRYTGILHTVSVVRE